MATRYEKPTEQLATVHNLKGARPPGQKGLGTPKLRLGAALGDQALGHQHEDVFQRRLFFAKAANADTLRG